MEWVSVREVHTEISLYEWPPNMNDLLAWGKNELLSLVIRLACSEISLSINEKKARDKSRKKSDNLAVGMMALAWLYAFNYDRAHCFNQW